MPSMLDVKIFTVLSKIGAAVVSSVAGPYRHTIQKKQTKKQTNKQTNTVKLDPAFRLEVGLFIGMPAFDYTCLAHFPTKQNQGQICGYNSFAFPQRFSAELMII